jgi:hypothetical protein
MSEAPLGRPGGITALAIFFGAGALISLTSFVSLSSPGGPLEPIWRLNPRAHEAFGHMGPFALLLMATLFVACGFTAVGLWSGKRWGYRLAVTLLAINLLGDIVNVVLGVEPRAIVGVPIVIALLIYLGRRRARAYFRLVTSSSPSP